MRVAVPFLSTRLIPTQLTLTRLLPALAKRSRRRLVIPLALTALLAGAAAQASPAPVSQSPVSQPAVSQPPVSLSEEALAAVLRNGSLEEFAQACGISVALGETQRLQQLQQRLLSLRPAPQPLAVVLANADVLLQCRAPAGALQVLERYGPASGAERRQWLLLQWQAAQAGLHHHLAAQALRRLAEGDPGQLETLTLPVGQRADGQLISRPALDLLAGHLESLGLQRQAAEVLLASRQPGEATARRLAQAAALLGPELPAAEHDQLLERALEQAAAAGSWGLVGELLDRQLAAAPDPTTAASRRRAMERRLRLSGRIDDAYGAWQLLRLQEAGGAPADGASARRRAQLEQQLRSPRSAGGHAAGAASPSPEP